MTGKRPQHLGEFIDICAAAAQFRRHAGLHQSCSFQSGKVFLDELVIVGRLVGTPREDRPKFAGDLGGAALLGGFRR